MNRFTLLFFVVFFAISGFAQNNSDLIIKIGDHVILKDEFVHLYEKNNDHLIDESEKKTPKEYLDLFVNFKLKVYEAERLGYDTLPGFISELKSYRAELAKPYLTDVQHTKEMVKTAYQHMKTELNASHILIRLPEKPMPNDTLKAWNKTNEIIQKYENGESFESLAEKYSDDPSVRQNKGNLGYFSAFQMVYPFENAAYNLEVGEVSKPVRTKFGYHLIKLNKRRAAKGQIKVAHIMKRLAENSSEETIKHQKQEIDSIAAELKKGADFGELAKANSDDRRSASNEGQLSWFGSSGMMPEFADPAFALEHDGDISPVIRTPYGWHIIKRIEYRPVPEFEEIEAFLTDKIRKDPSISRHSDEIFINKLKQEYGFKEDNQIFGQLKKEIEPAFGNDHFKLLKLEKPGEVIFSFSDQQITSGDFWDYYLNNPDTEELTDFQLSIENKYQKFVEDRLLQYEDAHLEDNYPEFRYLIKEYHDGILLFNISEDKIWNAAAQDSVGLQAFYEKNKKKYFWGDRFQGWVIKCDNLEVRDFIDAVFEQDPDIQATGLRDQVTDHFGEGKAEIIYGYFEKGDDELVDNQVWNAPEPEDYNESLHFIRGNGIPPQPKTLEEAKGLYISDYQQFLEDNWLKELRKRYKIRVKRRVLKSIESIK
ncbi:peptidylprolyl isomerase [Sunxiuqinia indica]|uniref:peptidylprolyl isomerase n=1 Tax=Sunxiuqinia indica TaxID=2692584 RepID=UPI0013577F69|nr:peptidylprolyl isomerase [Sunxiuqinia indica]